MYVGDWYNEPMSEGEGRGIDSKDVSIVPIGEREDWVVPGVWELTHERKMVFSQVMPNAEKENYRKVVGYDELVGVLSRAGGGKLEDSERFCGARFEVEATLEELLSSDKLVVGQSPNDPERWLLVKQLSNSPGDNEVRRLFRNTDRDRGDEWRKRSPVQRKLGSGAEKEEEDVGEKMEADGEAASDGKAASFLETKRLELDSVGLTARGLLMMERIMPKWVEQGKAICVGEAQVESLRQMVAGAGNGGVKSKKLLEWAESLGVRDPLLGGLLVTDEYRWLVEPEELVDINRLVFGVENKGNVLGWTLVSWNSDTRRVERATKLADWDMRRVIRSNQEVPDKKVSLPPYDYSAGEGPQGLRVNIDETRRKLLERVVEGEEMSNRKGIDAEEAMRVIRALVRGELGRRKTGGEYRMNLASGDVRSVEEVVCFGDRNDPASWFAYVSTGEAGSFRMTRLFVDVEKGKDRIFDDMLDEKMMNDWQRFLLEHELKRECLMTGTTAELKWTGSETRRIDPEEESGEVAGADQAGVFSKVKQLSQGRPLWLAEERQEELREWTGEVAGRQMKGEELAAFVNRWLDEEVALTNLPGRYESILRTSDFVAGAGDTKREHGFSVIEAVGDARRIENWFVSEWLGSGKNMRMIRLFRRVPLRKWRVEEGTR